MSDLRVGAILYGFCGGAFGRDSYGDKRIEAIGADWLVARDVCIGRPEFYDGDQSSLLPYLNDESETTS